MKYKFISNPEKSTWKTQNLGKVKWILWSLEFFFLFYYYYFVVIQIKNC